MENDYYCWQGNDLILSVRLQPKASRNEILGVHDNRLKIRLTTPPIDGKTNTALRKFIATAFCRRQ